MTHRINAMEIIADAPIGLADFANCYPALCYSNCAKLLSSLVQDGFIRRVRKGVYEVAA